MKIMCKLCERRLDDTFEAKWKHALKFHPEEMFSRLLPMVFDISNVREQGVEAGRRLRENVLAQFRSSR